MSDDTTDFAFELGKVVLKTLRKLDASKRESAQILRSLGGAEQERIVLQKIAKYWNRSSWFDRPDGLVVVTNYRMVFLTKLQTVTTTTYYLSFPLELIDNLETTTIMFISPGIHFQVQGHEYTFTFLDSADDVVAALQAVKQSGQ